MIINQTAFKYLTIAVIAILIALANYSAFADQNHHGGAVTNVTEVTEVTNITTVAQDQSTALAIASGQHNFDWGTNNWQAGIAGGSFKDESAMSFGVAKRFDGALINGSIGRTGGVNGYGAAINWRFR